MEEVTQSQLASIRNWLGTGSINIFGIQFSGKDTVGKELARLLDAMFISSGDVMRDTFINKKSEQNEAVWQAAKVGSLSGSLMPTNEFQQMITARLQQPDLNGKPLILSTVGRWIGEEQPVMQALNASHHPTKAVILLTISEAEAWKRWHAVHDTRDGGRHDDISEEVVARRIKEYHDKTLPVIDIYRNMGLLIEIDGEQPKSVVLSAVVDALVKTSRASASP